MIRPIILILEHFNLASKNLKLLAKRPEMNIMKLSILFTTLILGYSSFSYGGRDAIGCLDEQNRPRKVTLPLNKIISPEYIKELKENHPTISNIDDDLFWNEASLAHILCRVNGCTRADSISVITKPEKRANGFFFREIESVTCKQSPKNSWTFVLDPLNNAFDRKLRNQLPPVPVPTNPANIGNANQAAPDSQDIESGSILGE
jgi:hypothetical protein